MDLKIWFKGLGVFVLSSFVTALATMTLDPAGFNFSKTGLIKVGAAVLVIGVKAVLLYLKQSPLPAQTAGITNWTKVSGALALCLMLPACGLLAGCVSSWDQSTYASLAASKSVIDCAVAGYNHFDADIKSSCAADPHDTAFDPTVFYLPQTHDAQQAVEKARAAQVAAVDAFAGYAVARVAKNPAATVQAKQAAVSAYLVQLPTLLGAVRTLMGKSAAGVVRQPSAVGDPVRAIATLKPQQQIPF